MENSPQELPTLVRAANASQCVDILSCRVPKEWNVGVPRASAIHL
jgi:hypothetical protein